MIEFPQPFSRRRFIAQASCFGAFYAAAKLIPLPALAAELSADSRVSQTPIVDKGFASVRKIGNGLYATISDPSKGNTTISNGGFIVGKDAAASPRRSSSIPMATTLTAEVPRSMPKVIGAIARASDTGPQQSRHLVGRG